MAVEVASMGEVFPRYVGLGYLAYGTALLFAPRPSRALALASGAFGAAVIASSIQQWRVAGRARALTAQQGQRLQLRAANPLGESIPEALARTRAATGGKQFKRIRARSLEERIAILRKLALAGGEDSDVRAKALAVLTRKCGVGPARKNCVPEKGWDKEVEALFRAFTDPRSEISVRYTRDTITKDLFVGVKKTLQLGGGDCDDMSTALAALFMSVGYKAQLKVVQGKGAPTWSHVFIRVGIPPGGGPVERWISLDPSMPEHGPGWEPPKGSIIREKVFDI